MKHFEIQTTDLEKIKSQAQKHKFEFILIETKTNKQKGDIAGSKLLKFYKHLVLEIEKYFEIKNKGFNYNHQQSARCFFVVKNKKEILLDGPSIKDKSNAQRFKKEHKKTFTKGGKFYTKKKIDFTLREFLGKYKIKYKRQLKEMYLQDLKILD